MLVLGVVGAEGVAVGEEEGVGVVGEVDEGGVGEDLAAGATGELFADEEVAVAGEEVDFYAGVGGLAEGGFGLGVVEVGGAVVADPVVKEVAEDVEGFKRGVGGGGGFAAGGGEEGVEHFYGGGVVRGEVDVGEEGGGH